MSSSRIWLLVETRLETLSKKRVLCRRSGTEASTCGSGGGGGRGTRPQGMEKLIEGEVLRIRDPVPFLSPGSRQCCGSGMFIPDPDFYPSRIPDPKTATKRER